MLLEGPGPTATLELSPSKSLPLRKWLCPPAKGKARPPERGNGSTCPMGHGGPGRPTPLSACPRNFAGSSRAETQGCPASSLPGIEPTPRAGRQLAGTNPLHRHTQHTYAHPSTEHTSPTSCLYMYCTHTCSRDLLLHPCVHVYVPYTQDVHIHTQAHHHTHTHSQTRAHLDT